MSQLNRSMVALSSTVQIGRSVLIEHAKLRQVIKELEADEVEKHLVTEQEKLSKLKVRLAERKHALKECELSVKKSKTRLSGLEYPSMKSSPIVALRKTFNKSGHQTLVQKVRTNYDRNVSTYETLVAETDAASSLYHAQARVVQEIKLKVSQLEYARRMEETVAHRVFSRAFNADNETTTASLIFKQVLDDLHAAKELQAEAIKVILELKRAFYHLKQTRIEVSGTREGDVTREFVINECEVVGESLVLADAAAHVSLATEHILAAQEVYPQLLEGVRVEQVDKAVQNLIRLARSGIRSGAVYLAYVKVLIGTLKKILEAIEKMEEHLKNVLTPRVHQYETEYDELQGNIVEKRLHKLDVIAARKGVMTPSFSQAPPNLPSATACVKIASTASVQERVHNDGALLKPGSEQNSEAASISDITPSERIPSLGVGDGSSTAPSLQGSSFSNPPAPFRAATLERARHPSIVMGTPSFVSERVMSGRSLGEVPPEFREASQSMMQGLGKHQPPSVVMLEGASAMRTAAPLMSVMESYALAFSELVVMETCKAYECEQLGMCTVTETINEEGPSSMTMVDKPVNSSSP